MRRGPAPRGGWGSKEGGQEFMLVQVGPRGKVKKVVQNCMKHETDDVQTYVCHARHVAYVGIPNSYVTRPSRLLRTIATSMLWSFHTKIRS